MRLPEGEEGALRERRDANVTRSHMHATMTLVGKTIESFANEVEFDTYYNGVILAIEDDNTELFKWETHG